jgi:septum formation protein
MRIILASQSPRRSELLAAMGVAFEAIPSNFDEHLDDSRSPEVVSIELGLGKALEVARLHPNALVIGSDTIVTVDGHQLGKAADETDARVMLQSLAGRHSTVTTSLALVCLDRHIQETAAETCNIYFKSYNEQTVSRYLATGDYKDKAGAYGVQSGAAPLIARIEGRFDVIVGLPTHLLAEALIRHGIAAQPVELSTPQELTV